MNINTTTPQLNFQGKTLVRHLKPLAQYEGPTLKLTGEYEVKVADLNRQIEKWTSELIKSIREQGNLNLNKGDLKGYSMQRCTKEIEKCKNAIRELKITCFKQQKEEYVKTLIGCKQKLDTTI